MDLAIRIIRNFITIRDITAIWMIALGVIIHYLQNVLTTYIHMYIYTIYIIN